MIYFITYDFLIFMDFIYLIASEIIAFTVYPKLSNFVAMRSFSVFDQLICFSAELIKVSISGST